MLAGDKEAQAELEAGAKTPVGKMIAIEAIQPGPTEHEVVALYSTQEQAEDMSAFYRAHGYREVRVQVEAKEDEPCSGH